jgi:transcription antitermination factor NusG
VGAGVSERGRGVRATDPGPPPDVVALTDAGRLWFVLEVRRGSEDAVCEALAVRSGVGVVAWSHRQVRRGRNRHTYVDQWSNAAPGYLFAALAGRGSAAWAAGLRDVMGVLGSGEVPRPVSGREVAAFMAAAAPTRGGPRRRSRPGPPVQVGERVEVIDGPFAGAVSVVEAVEDGRAVLALALFGAIRPVRILLDAIRKLGA